MTLIIFWALLAWTISTALWAQPTYTIAQPEGGLVNLPELVRLNTLLGFAYVLNLITAHYRRLGSLTVWFGAGACFASASMLDASPWYSLPQIVLGLLTLGMLKLYDGPARRIETIRPYGNVSPLAKKASGHQAVEYQAVAARHIFADVDGYQALKSSLLEIGSEILQGKSRRNGILLSGKPGNGKTFLTEALAGELGLPFISVNVGNLESRWVGVATERAMQIFDDAEYQAPCLLFIDEIDSVLIDRSKVHRADSEDSKLVNALLTRIVDLRGRRVILVGATNYLDRLDSAAIREGRFDFKIEVPSPDQAASQGLLIRGFKRAGIAVSDEVVDLASRQWAGFSVSRLRAVVDETVAMTKQQKTKRADFALLSAALRSVQGRSGQRLPEQAKTLDALTLSPSMKNTLDGLAKRMCQTEVIDRLGGSLPTGLLFYGPPGTGKTLTAMALAKSSNYAFLATTGQDLVARESLIDELIEKASDLRPCILFIDEADDVLADRAASPYSRAATNKLISAMDGVAGKAPGVMFIAATNHPQMLDPATLRGGRFSEKLRFDLPDRQMLIRFVQDWGSRVRVPRGRTFTVLDVTESMSGLSLADASAILAGTVNAYIERTGGMGSIELTDIHRAKNRLHPEFDDSSRRPAVPNIRPVMTYRSA